MDTEIRAPDRMPATPTFTAGPDTSHAARGVPTLRGAAAADATPISMDTTMRIEGRLRGTPTTVAARLLRYDASSALHTECKHLHHGG